VRRRPSRSSLALRWLGVVVLLAIAIAYVHPLRAYLHARSQLRAREAEVTALSREKTALTERLKVTGTDGFIARQARELGLVRPGERLFIVSGVEAWQKRAGAGESGGTAIP
jgi:cell division protein FtsB